MGVYSNTHIPISHNTIATTTQPATLDPARPGLGRDARRAAIRRGGVPDTIRSRLWLRLLFPSSSTPTPAPDEPHKAVPPAAARLLMGAYPLLVAQAEEHVRLYARTGRTRRGPGSSGVFGVVAAPAPGVAGGGEGDDGEEAGPQPPQSSPLLLVSQQQGAGAGGGARRSNWIAEIEADVQRTYVGRGFFLDAAASLLSASDEGGAGVDAASGSGAGAGVLCCSRWGGEGEGNGTDDDDDGGGRARTVVQQKEQQVQQRARLSRVLWAFAQQDPSIKYCQGMNWVGCVLVGCVCRALWTGQSLSAMHIYFWIHHLPSTPHILDPSPPPHKLNRWWPSSSASRATMSPWPSRSSWGSAAAGDWGRWYVCTCVHDYVVNKMER